MSAGKKTIKNTFITVMILITTFAASIVLQDVLAMQEHVTTVFVFSIFVVSVLTEGYVYGLVAAVISVLAVNFAFTFPYFAFNFTIPENILSAVIMLALAFMTSTLATRVKKWEKIKKEGELEIMRANLLRAVSHDIRTPLTTIYGSSCAILENYDTLSDKQKNKLIGGIKEDAEWLIRMVENLLSVTKLDCSEIGIIKTPPVLDELIDSTYLKFRKRYPQNNIIFSLPEEMVMIPMDAILIEQVLVNMLENAVQHAEGMTELSLSVTVRKGKAVFEIADNGKGIDKEKLPGLFSGNISMTESASDSKRRNAGIGLSVCATIIKAHGGEITAKNRSEGGAVFSFVLDIEKGQEDE